MGHDNQRKGTQERCSAVFEHHQEDTVRVFQILVVRDPEGRECVSFIFIITQGGSDCGKNVRIESCKI